MTPVEQQPASELLREVVAQNAIRRAALAHDTYDPARGIGCAGERAEVDGCWVPRVLVDNTLYRLSSPPQREAMRLYDDFEYWCWRCVVIRDKITSLPIAFTLNKPQRRLVALMEQQRRQGKPIRVIMLKARQWGGSTVVQMYMAWMQLVRHRGWNSLICGHKHITSKSIKRMYNLLLNRYPPQFMHLKQLEDLDSEDATEQPHEEQPLRFTKLEGQTNVQQIEGRDCLVITGSARSEDLARGYDLKMAHLSEVAFWQDSTMHSPDDVVRTVGGTVPLQPDTVVVMESTANGMGGLFHDEWLRAQQGQSDKAPFFVPWHEIDIYQSPVTDVRALWEAMDDYERGLWEHGCTLEQINWYHHKRREYSSHHLMMAEFPTTDVEAFTATGRQVFGQDLLLSLSHDCCAPTYKGDITATDGHLNQVHLTPPFEGGKLSIWQHPEALHAYLAVVDIGGRSDESDYSVVAVWDVGERTSRLPAIVAQWRGHLDHDLLAWKAAQLAWHYHQAWLVIESNTLESTHDTRSQAPYLLQTLAKSYRNLYHRSNKRQGFHTNRATKQAAINALITAVRDHRYVERDILAVNEMGDYESLPNGGFAARKGKHDDILMTRAIGLMVMSEPLFRASLNRPTDIHTLTRDHWQPSLF